MTDEPDAHVVFPLDVVDDWPPVGGERVWAVSLGNEEYRIDNVPWFIRDLAVGDVVRAVAVDAQSHPTFESLQQRSDHVTIRLVVFRDGPLAGDLAAAIAPFTALGVYGEGVTQYGMVALDVEPGAPFDQIFAILKAGVSDGSWEYEEGRVTPEWVAATSPGLSSEPTRAKGLLGRIRRRR